jgi:hypothetical protein
MLCKSVWHSTILAVLFLTGCGGGGGESFPHQPAGTDPSISNLLVSPTSALRNEGGGLIDVEISLEFTDQEGDVYYLGTNWLDSSGSILTVGGAPLDHLVGQTSGEARATIQISTATAGQFTLRVWLVDQSVRASNKLDSQFTIMTAQAKAVLSVPSARSDFSMTELGGIVYVIGGRTQFAEPFNDLVTADVQVYDPRSGLWATKPSVPRPTANAMTVVLNELVYVMGGESAFDEVLDSVFVFDTKSDTWASRSKLPDRRYSAATIELGGYIYVIGGQAPGIVYDSTLRYDPEFDIWSTGSPMHAARINPCIVVIDGKILVHGGISDSQTVLRGGANLVETYDPELDIWSLSAIWDLPISARRVVLDERCQ